jgi:hypothetical protein
MLGGGGYNNVRCKVYYGMYIKCVHFNGTLNGSLFSENEGAKRKSDSACHRKRAQNTAKRRLDETVARSSQVSEVTNEAGDLHRKIAFLTEA